MNGTVVLGVTGGIAAYKAADLCSKMVQQGLTVHVIMTAAAQEFVGALTFRTLSRQPVTTSLWTVPEWRPEHVALAECADLLVIAPCTANMIGKIAHGIADDALSTFALTHSGKMLLAPAMNPKMWANPAVAANVESLKSRGVLYVGPESGRVACGDAGVGRMAEVATILAAVTDALRFGS